MIVSRFKALKNFLFNSFIPAITWWLLVLILMCTPGNEFPSLGSWIDYISLDKIIHIVLFGIMVFLFSRPLAEKNIPLQEKKQLILKIAIACSVWGLALEFIQHFWIPGRSLDFFDFVADSVGCFFAYIYGRRYMLR